MIMSPHLESLTIEGLRSVPDFLWFVLVIHIMHRDLVRD